MERRNYDTDATRLVSVRIPKELLAYIDQIVIEKRKRPKYAKWSRSHEISAAILARKLRVSP